MRTANVSMSGRTQCLMLGVGNMWPFKCKSKPVEYVEVTLGENDLLVIETDKYLSKEQREMLINHLKSVVIHKHGQVLILDSGMKVKVVHR